MKRTVALLLTAALLLGVLSGCYTREQMKPYKPTSTSPSPTEPSAVPPQTEEPSAPTEPTELPPENDEALIRWQNAGFRDYLPDEPVAMVSFADMVYTHPDLESLFAAFDALILRAEQNAETDELLEDFYRVYDGYIDFYTMDTLSNIRYSLNTTDSYYKAEYDYCEAQTPGVEEKLESLYKAFAACGRRAELEEAYFGEGFFLRYDDYEVYTNETYLRLSRQEEELKAAYRSLLEDPTVVVDGREQSYWELMETDDYTTYFKALRAYYDQYNPKIGEIYVELVKLRKQLAQALDYDSFSAYSYDFTYTRDYTPEQGAAFAARIEELLVPIYEQAAENRQIASLRHSAATEAQVEAVVESAAQHIGGTVADAFRFLKTYRLYDITRSAEKTEASFQTYIYSYEAPFVFVNSEGSTSDCLTFAHEFGHFTDSYYNYGANEDLETAETFSQAMEFLALCCTDRLGAKQKTQLLKLQLVDVLQTFVTQAAFASFEQRVFALPDEELTVDAVNAIYLQVCKDFGFYEPGYDFYYSQSWIDVMHFFEVPDYVISYCISQETALQVYQLEAAEEGAGVAAFFRLLDRDHQAGVQQVMEDAGLGNPFREGCIEETAEFIRAQLGLKPQ